MVRTGSRKTACDQQLHQIISGGQTGVDRAALDAAAELGMVTGGWCPRGRRAEDGRIPKHYPLVETGARSYAVRTEWNVRDSDGTLIIVLDEISSGTQLTLNVARRLQKPVNVVHLRPSRAPGLFANGNSLNEQLDSVAAWLCKHRIQILNIAGPRGSSHPDVYSDAHRFITMLLNRAGKA
ncbi:MAG: putative molybdenum carrier protein [Planctomycetaceae bacterium]